jgi:hypothetical protein
LDGISDGDMIDPSYFSSMFTYDYDVTMGVLYKKESFSDEELKTVNPDSSYVEQFDNLETRDLSSFVGEKSSYGIGEVVPFYKLLAKITNIDFSTNSHQVQFDLKFGIQSVKDPTIEVFVNDDVSEPVDGLDLKNLTRHLTCDITSLDDVKLIAQKVLYQKDDTTKTTLNSSDFSQVATNVVK